MGCAHALSQYPFEQDIEQRISYINTNAITTFTMSSKLVHQIRHGYRTNPYFRQFRKNLLSLPGAQWVNQLLYLGDRLCIPDILDVCTLLLHNAHDALGHFGAAKLASTMRASYFWPTLLKDCSKYVKTCDACQ